MTENPIICAISTAPGMGAIAIVRLSGEGCIALCDKVFYPSNQQSLSETGSNRTRFGQIKDENTLIDEVVVSIYRAPHSFTGEESVEIACHGSVFIQQQLLQLLIRKGAQMAAPGEFTQRAFLNGKMDLSEAEAVADLISSSSAAAHRMAMHQMKGGFATELTKLRAELLEMVSLLELELDFAEEDVEFADRSQLLALAGRIHGLLSKLCDSFALGNVLKNGVPVAIVGHTNVGKSTLLNVLLHEERAIVSDVAGTTRDVIEDTIILNGITFRFIDTAGIRKTSDRVENIGIERTFSKIEQASVVLLLTNPEDICEFTRYYEEVKGHLNAHAKLLVVLNKMDQLSDSTSSINELKKVVNEPIVCISAKQCQNIDALTSALLNTVNTNALSSNDLIVSNARHFEALSNALKAIDDAAKGLKGNLSGELVAQDIRLCIKYLGDITGQTIDTEEVLGNIFRRFCIGK